MNDNHERRHQRHHETNETTDYNVGFFGTVGGGKTRHLRRAVIRSRADDSEKSDWIDPKGGERE
jgi:hypothetical protein